MDLKGQFKCEKNFLWVMWVTTILAAVLTFVMDDVTAMFYTFVGGLGISSIVRFQQHTTINHLFLVDKHIIIENSNITLFN